VVEHTSHIDTAKGNLVVDDPTIWFNEPLFKERSHIEIHSSLGVLNWLAIVPDEPTGRKVSTLDSPMSQGPHAFVVNPPACHSVCVGRHSLLLTRLPCSHLVPWCRLRWLPPVLLSLGVLVNPEAGQPASKWATYCPHRLVLTILEWYPCFNLTLVSGTKEGTFL